LTPVLLPLAALVAVAVVLLVQSASGGGDFVPRRPADPCAARALGPVPAALEPLAERVVLTGLDEAACDLGLSRERLVLALGVPDERAGLDAGAIKAGLVRAVDRLDATGDLPEVSELLPEALDLADLPGLVQDAVGALPDGIVDDLLPTGALLHRSVEQLDLAEVLDGLEDPARLESALRDAILAAAKDEILAGLPAPLRDLLD
jgi:hypothetical protein